MTERSVLADRLVERLFGKRSMEPTSEQQPHAERALITRIQAAKEARQKRQDMLTHFKEF